MDVAEKQSPRHCVPILLRRSILNICVAEVTVGRMLMFSDYKVEGDNLKLLKDADAALQRARELMSELEDRYADMPPAPHTSLGD